MYQGGVNRRVGGRGWCRVCVEDKPSSAKDIKKTKHSLPCIEDKQKTIHCQIDDKLFLSEDNSTLEDKPFLVKIH